MNDLFYDPDAKTGKPITIAVIGLGNPLMTDDGAGLELWKLVKEAKSWGDNIFFEDGGTSGMNMLPLVEDSRAVIFLDATRTGAAPGSIIVRRDSELPAYFSQILSPHQIGLKDVLGAAQFRGFMPEKLVLVGIESQRVDFSYGVTHTVRNALPQAATVAIREIESLLEFFDLSCTK